MREVYAEVLRAHVDMPEYDGSIIGRCSCGGFVGGYYEWTMHVADALVEAAASGRPNKVEQPRATTADADPQDAAASLGELSLPAKDGAGLPVSQAPAHGRTDQ